MSFSCSAPEMLERHLGKPIFDKFARKITQGLPECNLALELACGVGVCSRRLSRVMPTGSLVIAADRDPDTLAIASRRPGCGDPISWARVDFERLPFDDACVGAIVCSFGMASIENRPAVLREVRRIMIPGGLFRYTVWASTDQNPWIGVVRSTAAKLLPDSEPVWFDQPFGFADVSRNLSLMEAAGFLEVRLTPIRLSLREADPLSLSRGFVQGNPALRDVIVDRGIRVADIEAKIAKALAANFGTPVRSTMRAFLFEAGVMR